MSPLLRSLLLVGPLSLLAGCSSQSTEFRSASLNNKLCEVCVLNGEPLLVLLVEDCVRNTSQTGPAQTFEGRISTNLDDNIRWSAVAGNDRTGSFTIGDQEFDLSNGRWFRIHSTDEGTQVAQFTANMDQFMQAANQVRLFDQLQAMRDENEQISMFFEQPPK